MKNVIQNGRYVVKNIATKLIYIFLICLATNLNAMNLETKEPKVLAADTSSTSGFDDLLLACQGSDIIKIKELFAPTLTVHGTECPEKLLLDLSRLKISTKDLAKAVAQISEQVKISRSEDLYLEDALQELENELEIREIHGIETIVWINLPESNRLMKLDDYMEEVEKEEAR